MGKVQFAVVTVVRNDLLGLKKSRASLESQTCKDWIHIIIDGGSTDGTLNYLKNLPRTNTLYVSEPDNGIYHAMNKGWQLASRDDFVYFLNARDCIVDEHSLAGAQDALKNSPNKTWGCTTHEEIAEDGSGWVCKLVSPPSISNQLYAFGYRSHQAILMRASLIERLGGFNEKYRVAADWDLVARAFFDSTPLTWVYSLGRFELGGMSSNRILEAHLELREIRKSLLWRGLKDRIFDDIWCAIYLKTFGFNNYLSKPIAILYPNSKNKSQRTRRVKQGNLRLWFGKSGIELTFIRRSLPRKIKFISKFRFGMTLYLHRKLSISPYINPKDFI